MRAAARAVGGSPGRVQSNGLTSVAPHPAVPISPRVTDPLEAWSAFLLTRTLTLREVDLEHLAGRALADQVPGDAAGFAAASRSERGVRCRGRAGRDWHV